MQSNFKHKKFRIKKPRILEMKALTYLTSST